MLGPPPAKAIPKPVVSGQNNLFPKSVATAIPTRTRLRVRRAPLEGGLWGRTFRDLDAQVLQHHIVPHSVYSTYIAAEPLRIDLDEEGYPVMAELSITAGACEVDPCLRPPIDFELGAVRFLDRPSRCWPVAVSVDQYNTLWHIKLSKHPTDMSIQAVTGAIWDIDAESCLCGLWFLRGQDDPYGRGRKAWRSRTWRRARRERILAGDPRIISPISRGEES